MRRVLAKPSLILDEMCRLFGKFASYLRGVLCKTRLIFPRINGPNVYIFAYGSDLLGCYRVLRRLSMSTQNNSKLYVYSNNRNSLFLQSTFVVVVVVVVYDLTTKEFNLQKEGKTPRKSKCRDVFYSIALLVVSYRSNYV